MSGESGAKKKRMQRSGGGKAGDKGLRHFSMKVCEKVEQKRRTTYNEVADELVAEFATEMDSAVDQAYDEKNIRRRVYDALNVLMAMEIITKEKKNIMWRGLPMNTQQEGTRLKIELSARKERLDRKRLHLQELLTHFISTKNLVKRNRSTPPQPAAEGGSDRIQMPFIVVNSRKEAVIDCEMAEDKQAKKSRFSHMWLPPSLFVFPYVSGSILLYRTSSSTSRHRSNSTMSTRSSNGCGCSTATS